MEEVFTGKLEEVAYRLAYHFSEAREHERALKYHLRAAELADGIDAVAESASHYSRALKAAEQAEVPGGEVERIRLKLSELAAPR